VKPSELSDPEFLAPYAKEMGVNEELLAQIQTEVLPH
jgi:cytochrome c oxidase subunit 2